MPLRADCAWARPRPNLAFSDQYRTFFAMAVLNDSERSLAQSFSKLTYCNPFLRERIEFERDILGADFIDSEFVWSARAHLEGERPNIAALSAKAENLADSIRSRLAANQRATPTELDAY